MLILHCFLVYCLNATTVAHSSLKFSQKEQILFYISYNLIQIVDISLEEKFHLNQSKYSLIIRNIALCLSLLLLLCFLFNH